jgi:hypothetical protein
LLIIEIGFRESESQEEEGKAREREEFLEKRYIEKKLFQVKKTFAIL